MRNILWSGLVAACLLACAVPFGFSQATTGTVLGRVMDTTGAIVPGASIDATNVATGVSQKSTSDQSGAYRVPFLVPGTYRVTVTMTGFKALFRTVDLNVDQQITLDFALPVGALNEVVNVTDATPVLQTQSVDTGQVIETKEILDLPLLGRNVLDLTRLTTGVSNGGGGNSDNLSVNGQREFANSVVLGGVEVTGNRNNDTSITPSVDAVQEFKVVTSAYAAEFGRASGAVVLLQTKTGTNGFHGSLYDFYRPSVTAATDYFSHSSSELNQNNFGATLGGYLRKNKTFFFVSYEGLRNRDGGAFLGNTVPLDQIGFLPNGDIDLSGLKDPYTGNQVPIFDPNNFYAQFPGNIIPASEVSPAGLATLLNFYPVPTLPGIGFGWNNNVLLDDKTTFNSDTIDTRMDHTFSQNDRVSGEYHYAKFASLTGDPYAGLIPVAGGGGGDTADNTHTKNQAMSIDWTHSMSSRMFNEFRFGLNHFALEQLSLLNGRNVADQFGVNNINLPDFPQTTGFPQIYLETAYETIGGSTYKPLTFLDRNYQFVDSISLSRGNHEMKFGGEFRLLSSRPEFSLFPTGYQYYQAGQYQPSMTSDANYTFYDTSAYFLQGGSDISDLLLGLPTYTYLGLQLTNPESKSWELHGFVQDQWKFSRNLSFFYGVRYEYQNPYYEADNHSSNFDPTTGLIQLAGRGGNSSALVNADKNNFGPRVGFAYQLNPKTVLRGGYGIYYTPENDAREDVLTKNYPFNNQQTFFSSFYDPEYQLDAGVTRNTTITIPDGASSIDPSTIPDSKAQQAFYVNPRIRTGYSQLYNVTMQREIAPNLSLEAGFVGSLSRKLPYAIGNINPGSVSFPALGSIQGLYGVGSGNYNSLQVKATKRYSNHMSFLVAYTYGKSIDNGPAPFNLGRNHSQPQNPFDLGPEYAVSSNDIKHSLIGSFIYELPVGRNHLFLSNLGKVGDAFLGGWQINAISEVHSGLPINVVVNGNLQNAQGLRPNLIGDPYAAHRTIGPDGQWLNIDAFCALNCTPALTGPGDLGRNALRGPGFFNVDFSLFKDLKYSEHLKLQLRIESFNATNSPSFANPSSDLSAGALGFGKITGTSSRPRVMQFAVKVIF